MMNWHRGAMVYWFMGAQSTVMNRHRGGMMNRCMRGQGTMMNRFMRGQGTVMNWMIRDMDARYRFWTTMAK